VTAGENITQIPISTDEHSLITSEEPWRVPQAGNMTAIVVNDSAATLHTGADVIFFLFDAATGSYRQFTFAMDRRRQRLTCTAWALTTSSRISCYVLREDGTNEPLGVSLEVTMGVPTSNHVHGPGVHTHLV
jgi:CCR4-NOT transcriptional regulation complex NOT5 subunit